MSGLRKKIPVIIALLNHHLIIMHGSKNFNIISKFNFQ